MRNDVGGGSNIIRQGRKSGGNNRIDQPLANDFQLGATPGIKPATFTPVDFSNVMAFGRELLQRGAEEAAENGRQNGINAQAESDGNVLVKRDVSFFGLNRADKAFNEGAKLAFVKQKSEQFQSNINALSNEHFNDPKAFKAAVEESKAGLFEGVTADTSGQLELLFKSGANKTFETLQNQAIAKERQAQGDLVNIAFEDLNRLSEQEMESTGTVTDQTNDKFSELIDRARAMGVREVVLEGHIQNNEKRVAVSSLVFQFQETDDKSAFLKTVLEADGPLSDFSFTERLGIHSKLSSLASVAKAERTAIVKSLRTQLNEATKTENSGNKAHNSIAIAQQAIIYPELQAEVLQHAQAVQVRENLDTARRADTSDVETQIDLLRGKESTEGLTGIENNLLKGLIDVRGEQIKARQDGSGLEFSQNNGLIELSHVDATGKLNSPEFRENRVNVAREQFPNASFYLDSEIDTFKQIWETGQASKRRELLGTIFQQTPQTEVSNVLKQISTKHAGLPFVASFASGGEAEKKISFDMINGMELLDNVDDAFENKSQAKKTIQDKLTSIGFIDRTGIKTEQVADAILGLVANEARNNQDSDLDSSKLINNAIGRVLGYNAEDGEPTINDHPVIPFERGMKSESITNFWNNITDDMFIDVAGSVPVDSFGGSQREITAEEIRENGWPVFVAPGVYAIALPRAPDSVSGLFQKSDTVFLLDRNSKKTFTFKFDDARNHLNVFTNTTGLPE